MQRSHPRTCLRLFRYENTGFFLEKGSNSGAGTTVHGSNHYGRQLLSLAEAAEVGNPQSRRIEDAHPVVFALPAFAFRWELRGESGEPFSQRYGYCVLPIAAVECLYYSGASHESY